MLGNVTIDPGVLMAFPLTHESKVNIPSRHRSRGERMKREKKHGAARKQKAQKGKECPSGPEGSQAPEQVAPTEARRIRPEAD